MLKYKLAQFENKKLGELRKKRIKKYYVKKYFKETVYTLDL